LKNYLENINFEKLRRNIKFQIFLVFTSILFFLKILFNGNSSTLIFIGAEAIVILSAFLLGLYFTELFQKRKQNPLSLVMNVGILSGLFFFIVNFSEPILDGLFDNILEVNSQPGLIFNLIHFFYAFLFLGTSVYIFLVFKQLYFLKQKRSTTLYFSTMVVFLILASASAGLSRIPDLDFIKTTFFIITILLISINSIKISWIAFITKKEKISLLVLSVLIAVLFIVNLINNSDKEVHSHLLNSFSPAVHQFLNLILIYGIIYFSILFFTTLFHLPTAEAYDRKAREISSLQYFSSLINQVLDFNDLEETITELSLKAGNADSSWIVWYKEGNIKTSAHKNIGYLDAKLISEYILRLPGSDKTTNTTVFHLDRFTTENEESNKFTYAAVTGLKNCNDAQGFLILTIKNDKFFDEEDVSAINTFADYSSIAVENCRLLKENIEKERLEKELDVAREIQRKILPIESPVIKNLSISSVFIPAFEVGGDYYDFFHFSDDKLGFVIADVSGKGISAAFIMAEVKGIFESLSRILSTPREILIKANEILKSTLERKNFVSAAYGIIDLNNEKLVIARAGHCPVLLLRDNKTLQLRPGGLGLGLNYSEYFSETLEESEIDLHDNDTIVLYTDGITEAKNSEMDDFGNRTFEKILLENINKTAEEISNQVIKEVTLFSQSISQHDDITLVILKWKQKHKSDGEKEWQNSAQQLKIKVI
jgi:phosphoserine phosphatase RsbU/P